MDPASGDDLGTRRVSFAYPDDLDVRWHTRLPEFACAANAVSLLMPHVEPYVVKSVRAALPRLDGDLRPRVEDYLRQERQHHAQHRRFNRVITSAYPRLVPLERRMRGTFGWLSKHRSARFNLAFAAGFETVAYASARWTDKHLRELFAGADAIPSTLFLWHLAEEVEHKSVAFDVYRAVGGKRLTYAMGMITSALMLATFSVIGTLIMLGAERRLFSTRSHLRLFRWSFSFVFELFPTMFVSALPRHHPDDFSDPIWLSTWLKQFDPDTGTMPLYSLGFLTA